MKSEAEAKEEKLKAEAEKNERIRMKELAILKVIRDWHKTNDY